MGQGSQLGQNLQMVSRPAVVSSCSKRMVRMLQKDAIYQSNLERQPKCLSTTAYMGGPVPPNASLLKEIMALLVTVRLAMRIGLNKVALDVST